MFVSLYLLIVLVVSGISCLPRLVLQKNVDTLEGSTKLITECDNLPSLLTIDYIRLTPEVPARGQKLVIDFKGYLSEQVPEGTKVEIIVKLGVIQLIRKTFDFCEKIQEINEKCPVPQGDLVLHKEIDLPQQIPPGKYTVHAEITTPESKRVTCLVGATVFPRK
ncbi:ML domain-containing protein [Sporodiniella umbellata]|nr:ML domain-containing protein [Sporodiniella umbellata]